MRNIIAAGSLSTAPETIGKSRRGDAMHRPATAQCVRNGVLATALLGAFLIAGCANEPAAPPNVTGLNRTGPVLESNDSNFANDVLSAKQPVLVDVSIDGCAPCRKLAPIIDSMAVSDQYKDKLKFVSINASHGGAEICQKYAIQIFPTVLIFIDGKLRSTQTGLVRKEILDMRIEEAKTPSG